MIQLHCTGLPHSDIPGSKVICTYPGLFAAYHVLHRLPEPRHPPFALICFFYFFIRIWTRKINHESSTSFCSFVLIYNLNCKSFVYLFYSYVWTVFHLRSLLSVYNILYDAVFELFPALNLIVKVLSLLTLSSLSFQYVKDRSLIYNLFNFYMLISQWKSKTCFFVVAENCRLQTVQCLIILLLSLFSFLFYSLVE